MSRSTQAGLMCELNNQRGQQRVTGPSLDSAAAMELSGSRQCLPKAMALFPRVLLCAHCLQSQQEVSLQLTSLQILLCVCVLPIPPKMGHFIKFYHLKSRDQL